MAFKENLDCQHVFSLSTRIATRLVRLLWIFPLCFSQPSWSIQGGFDVESEKWNFSIALQSQKHFCSGTLLTKTLAVTAAHCIDDSRAIFQVFSGSRLRHISGTGRVEYIDPDYTDDPLNHDLAFIRLQLNKDLPSFSEIGSIMNSEWYLEWMNAQNVPRSLLVVGYGNDENDEVESRKAAILSRTSVSVGPTEMLWSGFDHMGTTLRGDSGGGVFAVNQQGGFVFTGVTSGGYFSAATSESRARDYANVSSPIVPTLCAAPSDIKRELAFDDDSCAKIRSKRAHLNEVSFEASISQLVSAIKLLEDSAQKDYFPPFMTEKLAVSAMAQGVQSRGVARIVRSYMKRSPFISSSADRETRRTLASYLFGVLQGKYPDVTGDLGYRPRNEAIVEILDRLSPIWRKDISRIERDNPSVATHCESGDCEKYDRYFYQRNSFEPDWVRVFPVAQPSVVKLLGFDEARRQVCMVLDALLERDRQQLYEIAKVHGMPLSSLEVVKTDDSFEFRLSSPGSSSPLKIWGSVSDPLPDNKGSIEWEIYGLSLSPTDVTSMLEDYRRLGFHIESNGNISWAKSIDSEVSPTGDSINGWVDFAEGMGPLDRDSFVSSSAITYWGCEL